MDFGTIQQVDIDEQMKSAYLDYAMSVIVARALPDAKEWSKTCSPANSLRHV
jgi:DNA gyrase subunit A